MQRGPRVGPRADQKGIGSGIRPHGTTPPHQGAQGSHNLIAELHSPVRQTGVRYTGKYAVSFRGEYIVTGSRGPECDLARALLARGITGKVKVLDAETGKHRSNLDIQKAAKVKAEEGPSGVRFVKYRAQTVGDRTPSLGEHLPLTMVASVSSGEAR